MSTQFRATEERIAEAQKVLDRHRELMLELLQEKIKLEMQCFLVGANK